LYYVNIRKYSVHETSQVTWVLLRHPCHSTGRKPVLTWAKANPPWVRPGPAKVCHHPRPNPAAPHARSRMPHAGRTGKLHSLRRGCRKKVHQGTTKPPSSAQGKAVFSSDSSGTNPALPGTTLPETPRDCASGTQPTCSRGTETQSRSDFWSPRLVSLLSSPEPTEFSPEIRILPLFTSHPQQGQLRLPFGIFHASDVWAWVIFVQPSYNLMWFPDCRLSLSGLGKKVGETSLFLNGNFCFGSARRWAGTPLVLPSRAALYKRAHVAFTRWSKLKGDPTSCAWIWLH